MPVNAPSSSSSGLNILLISLAKTGFDLFGKLACRLKQDKKEKHPLANTNGVHMRSHRKRKTCE